MAVTQTFETTVLSAENDFTAEILFIPNRSFQRRGLAPEADYFTRRLGLQEIGRIDESKLETTLALLLAAPYHVRAYLHDPQNPTHLAYLAGFHRQFAHELASEELVPIQESPLTTESLTKLIVRAAKDPVGLGALAGVYVATGGTPLLLIWLPTGIIVCCVAVGIGKALQVGLQKKIQKLLKGR